MEEACRYQGKKRYKSPMDLFLEPKWTIWDYSDITVFLKSTMKKLRDTLETGLQLQKVDVILDPDTGHPDFLDFSEDQKSVTTHPVPNRKRLEYNPYVLGYQRFSTGRHFWEVIVGDTAGWAIGVARKPVNITSVDKQIIPWHFGKWRGNYRIFSPSERSELVLTEKPTRMRISLNCEGGQVSFFDARTAALLCTLSDASLVGETLLPSFFLQKNASLTLP